MSRSVMTVSNAVQIVYLTTDAEECWQWDDELDYIKDAIKNKYTSFRDVNTWDDREEHRVLENGLAKVVVCEYCNLVSVNLVPLDLAQYGWGAADKTPLAEHWCEQIADGFAKLFPARLRSLGHASNGEQFFERAER